MSDDTFKYYTERLIYWAVQANKMADLCIGFFESDKNPEHVARMTATYARLTLRCCERANHFRSLLTNSVE